MERNDSYNVTISDRNGSVTIQTTSDDMVRIELDNKYGGVSVDFSPDTAKRLAILIHGAAAAIRFKNAGDTGVTE